MLNKIQAALHGQGLSLGDVVQLKVFLVGDPAKGGKLDFAGLQAAYTEFFATAEQPRKPTRTALQVVALPLPGALVEIEAIAAKAP
ncbi:putative reactive intermediate deaminase TdcF [compost metagenome]